MNKILLFNEFLYLCEKNNLRRMKVDSIIFDMDGTLWDNVNTYVAVWNEGLKQTGYSKTITREDLIGLMGKDARTILNVFLPDSSLQEQDLLYDKVLAAYDALSSKMKPIVYPYVLEGLEILHTKYKLFLLSNCEEGGLIKFMNYTKTAHLITDYMEHGQNLQPKSVNLQLLMKRNNLQSSVYVGDTESDSKESAKANVPFVYATYGFGKTENYALKFDSFKELVGYFIKK